MNVGNPLSQNRVGPDDSDTGCILRNDLVSIYGNAVAQSRVAMSFCVSEFEFSEKMQQFLSVASRDVSLGRNLLRRSATIGLPRTNESIVCHFCLYILTLRQGSSLGETVQTTPD